MLMQLADYLSQYHSGFNVFQYLTLRTILGVLTALFIALMVGPSMIRSLARFQIGQTIRGDGPESHFTKAVTPTMGGLWHVCAMPVRTRVWSVRNN